MNINRYHLTTPIEIVTTHLGIDLSYKQHCIDEIYRLGDSMNLETNVKAIMSSYKIWEETDILDPLIYKIKEFIKDLNLYSDPRFVMEVSECWSAIYKKDHFTLPHLHTPSFISFVYYLKTDNNSSPLIFDECNFSQHPQDDMLIAFPSDLVHSVPPQLEGDDRICLAGNFNLSKIKDIK